MTLRVLMIDEASSADKLYMHTRLLGIETKNPQVLLYSTVLKNPRDKVKVTKKQKFTVAERRYDAETLHAKHCHPRTGRQKPREDHCHRS